MGKYRHRPDQPNCEPPKTIFLESLKGFVSYAKSQIVQSKVIQFSILETIPIPNPLVDRYNNRKNVFNVMS